MATAAKKYWSMKAKGPKAAEILIYEQIGSGFWSEGIGAKQFARDLKDLGDIDDLTVRINSEGGSVFEGQAIYSQLKAHKARKTVHIDGLAASIASVIAMAGDTIIMPKNATMMVHDPWTIAAGNAEDMRKAAEALDTIKLGIIAAYREKSGLDDAEISAIMSEETWFSAEDAVEKGFADEMGEEVRIAAMKFDLSKYKHVPQALALPKNEKKKECEGKVDPDKECEECPMDGCDVKKKKAQAPAPPAQAAPKAANKPKEGKTMAKVPCSKCGSPVNELGECSACEQKLQTQAAVEQARKNELARCAALEKMGKEFSMPQLAEVGKAEGWSEDQLRTAILAKIKSNSTPGEPLNISVHPAHEGKPFRSLGDQLLAIKAAALGESRAQQQLREVYNAPSGASEAVPSDGGFLVQSDFTTSLLDRANETMIIAPRCRHIPVSGNGINAPIVNETDRATGSRWGGVQVYRVNEAATATSGKKPKFDNIEMKLEKIMGVAYATDELLTDATALEAVFSQAFTEEFGFVVDDEIINGTGAGQMLGILNAGSLVSVTKETGQIAATIVAENIINMYSRMPARSKANAVWLINSEIMPQLMQMVLPIGAAGVPLFMPAGGLSGVPYGTIFGKPVIEVEQCAALGTLGDILFVDLTQYLIIEKGGINAARSLEVRFLYDEQTFKWTARNNGQPIWKKALTPYKGSATVSPFVGLATRA